MLKSIALLLLLGGTVLAQPSRDRFTDEYPLNLNKLQIRMPTTKDNRLADVLYDRRTIYYKLPQVYQHYINVEELAREGYNTRGLRSQYAVYETTVHQDFNANRDFPWETTIGLNHAKKAKVEIYKTINFIKVPRGETILIVNERPIKWIFPDKTVVGEMLILEDPQTRYPFEIRTRTKEKDTWIPRIYRPIKNKAELESFIGEYNPGAKYLSLRNAEEDEVFKMEGVIEYIPNLSKPTVQSLLRRDFQDVTDEVWSDNSRTPTSKIEYNIFPINYTLGLIGDIGTTDCANCHRQTQISVRNLIPKEPLILQNLHMVGFIRGCDGIFSWYPFEKSSISTSVNDVGRQLRYRDYDIRNNIIEPYDPQYKYPNHIFTTYVKDSLADNEIPNTPKLFMENIQQDVSEHTVNTR